MATIFGTNKHGDIFIFSCIIIPHLLRAILWIGNKRQRAERTESVSACSTAPPRGENKAQFKAALESLLQYC